MIEKIIFPYLKNALNCPVCVERLEDKETYVYIEKTQGNAKTGVKTCTIAIQSYGKTFQKSLELNEQVKKTMEKFVELDEISSCRLRNDYKFDDVTRKKHRYQAVYEITYY